MLRRTGVRTELRHALGGWAVLLRRFAERLAGFHSQDWQRIDDTIQACVARWSNAGANEVLKKPLLSRELATSLARVLHPQKSKLR